MKMVWALIAALVVVASTMALPVPSDGTDANSPDVVTARGGRLLCTGAESGSACHLVVKTGSRTILDRGHAATGSERYDFTGSYRYWEEPVGRVLYVYDDAQNLVARVVNPHTVAQLDRTVIAD